MWRSAHVALGPCGQISAHVALFFALASLARSLHVRDSAPRLEGLVEEEGVRQARQSEPSHESAVDGGVRVGEQAAEGEDERDGDVLVVVADDPVRPGLGRLHVLLVGGVPVLLA
jgi:hypothetical protein